MVNLTESGYSDSNAKWVLGGKAMIWNSDRAGYRSHGSWGSEDDTYIMFFDVDAYNRFLMSKEDIAAALEIPKKTDMGDFAFPCFRLAKAFRKAPNMIAEELTAQINEKGYDIFDKAVNVGAYINAPTFTTLSKIS